MSVKYIIGHWTAGNHKPNATDLKSYQLLIDGEGKRHNGKEQGRTESVGGLNSITYNISCCGGLLTSAITPVQFEAFCAATAEKLRFYKLKPKDFYTHAEIGKMCRDNSITRLLPWNDYLSQNIGKIDLTILPAMRGSAKVTGDYLRNKINWYFTKK